MRFGNIVDLKIYEKVCRKEHFMVKFKGFGISTSELDEIEREEARYIRIVYLGSKGHKVYLCTLKQFLDSDKKHTFEEEDVQHFVSVDDMFEHQF